MDEEQLKAVSDPTRLRILGLLSQDPLTNTGLFKKLDKRRLGKGIVHRESIYKSLAKLRRAGLISRAFNEKRGFVYSLAFKEMKVEGKLFGELPRTKVRGFLIARLERA